MTNSYGNNNKCNLRVIYQLRICNDYAKAEMPIEYLYLSDQWSSKEMRIDSTN